MSLWTAGTQVGPYTLMAPLGAGGMGEVWKARDERLGRIVAIKRLTSHDGPRFDQEARAIAALNHPNICQIYDVGPDYLVMEYVQGAMLRGPLRQEEALRLAIQIAAALEEAHCKRILHRDLKPGNVLVTTTGVAKLLDFGLARSISNSGETQTTAVMGTPLYMSPEQTEGQPLDERSDIFSFGALFYEMLSGRRAFDTLAAVLRDEPASLEGPGAEIALRCLAKQPQARIQSIADVKAALERVGTKPMPEHPSIAVLPFANMSFDKEQEFFSDGLAEEIINALAQIPGLKVTARTSAFAFRGKEQDIRKIAEALDVRTILEGSVRRSGDRLRVTAQLINAADGYHLWSQRYDRQMADVFEMQDEIATCIAAALQVKLLPSANARRYEPSLPAYEAYLKARHFNGLRPTVETWEDAKSQYERAIALDPGFAIAYSDLAWHYALLASYGWRPPLDVLPTVRMWALRALDLDASLPHAHAVLALSTGMWDFDWAEAERRFELAMERHPVPPTVRGHYALYLLAMGRPLEGVEQIRQAIAEDPLLDLYRILMFMSLWAAGRDEQAVAELHRLLEFDEAFAAADRFAERPAAVCTVPPVMA